MSTPKDVIWEIEPHTLAKHQILENYLKAWFPIISRYSQNGINYVDGFAGPGEYNKGEKGSPIIALEVAINHSFQFKGQLHFTFIEEDTRRAKHLEEKVNSLNLPNNFRTEIINGKFHDVISSVLNSFDDKGYCLAPTFFFVDPFGFSGIPASIVDRLLSVPKVEVFINFAVDSVNRFIGTAEAGEHINELFGTSEAVVVINSKSADRVRDLRDLYQIKLQQSAKFVRYFEMKNNEARPIYYLFFATNHELGHLKMKEAMWRVDEHGDFRFSDATDRNQTILFENNEFGEVVFELIREKVGIGKFEVAELRKFVENDTGFLDKHFTQAMRFAENRELIEADPLRKDGKKRRAKTFPDEAIIYIK